MVREIKNEDGFSLVELMVVVAIIGVLAGLAVPRFRTFQAKARQVEAVTALKTMYTLQESYYGENEVYANMALTGRNGAVVACPSNAIGFRLTPCNDKLRYGIRVTGASNVAWNGDAISGTGINNKVVPGCAVPDFWQIDQDKFLRSKFNAISLCF